MEELCPSFMRAIDQNAPEDGNFGIKGIDEADVSSALFDFMGPFFIVRANGNAPRPQTGISGKCAMFVRKCRACPHVTVGHFGGKPNHYGSVLNNEMHGRVGAGPQAFTFCRIRGSAG
jgi:hypothetical protein